MKEIKFKILLISIFLFVSYKISHGYWEKGYNYENLVNFYCSYQKKLQHYTETSYTTFTSITSYCHPLAYSISILNFFFKLYMYIKGSFTL